MFNPAVYNSLKFEVFTNKSTCAHFFDRWIDTIFRSLEIYCCLFCSQTPPLRKQNNLARDLSRSVSPCSSISTSKPGRRRRVRRPRCRTESRKFGYQIQDVDEFLTKSSLDSPGNIPMVLSTSCVLYQTQIGAPQKEVSLVLFQFAQYTSKGSIVLKTEN